MWDILFEFFSTKIFNATNYDFNFHWVIGGVSVSLTNYLSILCTITVLGLLVAFLITCVVWAFKWFSGLVRS